MKQYILSLFSCVLISIPVWTQNVSTQIGDYIESTSYNEDKRGTERILQYMPDGQDFVCVNGKNRFTRALYCNHSAYRIETSDRPIFAVYNKKDNKNIRFSLVYKDKEILVDSTDYCEARYTAGKRSYIVKDKNWGNADISISVLPFANSEGAIWRIIARNFTDPVSIKVKICEIRNRKLHRNGDMGADPYGSFEAPDNPIQLNTIGFELKEKNYVTVENQKLSHISLALGDDIYEKAETQRNYLATRISFDTPDAYINTLGGVLSIAADGIWDGKTWLHGAVGWRMPLAGWRAAYVGDALGWDSRQRSHFDAYAASLVTDVPCVLCHPSQDSTQSLSRAVERWGTPMYSNGYICRNPNDNHQMHHYDMNLNFIDELMWHFCWNADTSYMRKMWPVITSHLAWEKMNFDPDNDGLYDAYCCIWASDALYYNSGAVTHSSAYNYRANRMAALIANKIGKDSKPYRDEAEKILAAMNSRLWINKNGCWAEYQDFMGLKRKHESAALWTVYTAIDCGACDESQAYAATKYVDSNIPHIPIKAKGLDDQGFYTLSTSNWLPYAWSINNVAQAEVMHTALAYFEAGRADDGFKLMKGNILDEMYVGDSPGNFGQISFYDAARGECYRDFGDNIGISSRTLINGLFGVMPDALNGKCVLQPGFPRDWTHAKFTAPYLIYSFHRTDSSAGLPKDTYTIIPKFQQHLDIILRVNSPYSEVKCVRVNGHDFKYSIKENPSNHFLVETCIPYAGIINVQIEWNGHRLGACGLSNKYNFSESPVQCNIPSSSGNSFADIKSDACVLVDMDTNLNACINDIFKNKYVSPSSPYTTLRIPEQGIGEWCHPKQTAYINDSVFRSLVTCNNRLMTSLNIPFRTPAIGKNVAYTSLWDNYPNSICVSLKGKASHAYLLMAGSTNHMQSHIANGVVIVSYWDGTSDSLLLVNPYNWCPIEQDYYVDGKAFCESMPRPFRIHFGSGTISRDLGTYLHIQGVYGREIPQGAGVILDMPLQSTKKLKNITLKTLSNDVVIGLMAVTLQRNR